MVKLVIDMMGGDNGSKATIEAVELFLKEISDCELILVGDEKELEPLKGKATIIPSTQIVPMESTVMQAMKMRDSSMYKAVNAVLSEKADGIVSCGSTGAFLSLTSLIVKKIEGILRPALVTPFPTKIKDKHVVLLDVGASNDNSPQELVQFAKMGEAYYKAVYGKFEPDVYLISNGVEEGKGSPLMKETYALLKEGDPCFKGYVEGRDVFEGHADVVVFDGFTGNVFLKTAEGVAKMMAGFMKDAFTYNAACKIGYVFAKKGVNDFRAKMDYKKVGGALLLGVNTIAVKAHGNSTGDSFCASMKIAYRLAKNGVVDRIKENL